MISLNPEMLVSMVKMIPESKIDEGRKAIIDIITAAEEKAKTRLMAVLRLNEDNTCIVFCIYTAAGRLVTSMPLWNLDSLTQAFDALKNFDFSIVRSKINSNEPSTTTAAPGLSYTGATEPRTEPAEPGTEPTEPGANE